MEEVGEKSPAQWAIDILEGKNYQYERRFYNKYTGEIFGGIIGATSPWLRNYALHRPLYAGLQYHIAFGIVGVAIGRLLTVSTDQYYAKRDAILLDYIKKHPQRFPEPQDGLQKGTVVVHSHWLTLSVSRSLSLYSLMLSHLPIVTIPMLYLYNCVREHGDIPFEP